jgi:protein arginine kinase activator
VLCEECRKRKAVINFTQIVDNEMTTFHLCESCAEKKGVGEKKNVPESPINNFLSQIGSHLKDEKETGDGKSCDTCGATFAQFQKSGRLGCPQCYFAFEQELGNILRRVQGSQVHVGRGPRARSGALTSEESRILELKKLLEESVRREEFERAAMLRDEIRGLERQDAEGGEPPDGPRSDPE